MQACNRGIACDLLGLHFIKILFPDSFRRWARLNVNRAKIHKSS